MLMVWSHSFTRICPIKLPFVFRYTQYCLYGTGCIRDDIKVFVVCPFVGMSVCVSSWWDNIFILSLIYHTVCSFVDFSLHRS